jgi:HAD superfamily hydrolase (TIGR01509 family)
VRAFERGRIAPEDFGRLFVREWDIPLSPDIFLAEFTTWPKGFHPQAPALLARLRARGRIACLSNSNALHWTRFGGFCEHFDVALSSHVLGVVKPDAEAFTAALETCGAAPHETLFFDDSLANVRAAERGGLRAVHVDGFDELLDALDRLGLNVEEDV